MTRQTEFLIVGAGPFGLSMAAHARDAGLDHLVVGRPMEFWQQHMPRGMLLRSACDWHLDAAGEHTIEGFLRTRNQVPADVEPLSLEFYLQYARWFQQQKQLEVLSTQVARLDSGNGSGRRFVATLEDGTEIEANQVLLALGFRDFKHVPHELAAMIPAGQMSHTCDLVQFEQLAGRRCLIVGGRQSAFEWAALLREHGAAEIHVCHRHDTPQFAPADWSWVTEMIEAIIAEPGWYRQLTDDERKAINARFWAEGRLKLEPWLKPRIDHPHVHLWPRSAIIDCQSLESGALRVELQNGRTLEVDHVILATGYQVDLDRVPLLAQGTVGGQLAVRNGFPVLDEHLQRSIPGLYFTSMPATQDFGAFFAFTVSVVASTKIIGRHLAS